VATAIDVAVAAATRRHASGATSGWSPKPTTTLSCPASSAAATAARSDEARPSAHASFRTPMTPGGTSMPASTAPVTTNVASSPAATAAAMAHSTTGRPRNGASSFGVGPS
jgi:hypothetical protein